MKTLKNTLKKALFLATIAGLTTFSIAFSQEKPKEEFKPSGKVWGLTFGDFYWKMGGDTLADKTPWGGSEFGKKYKGQSGITFRRIYLGYDYQLAPNFNAKFLLEGGDGVTTGGGDRTVYIKAANLEWKNIIKRHSLYIGQVGTTSFSTAEGTWGLRAVEKVVGDARGWLPSNDLGFRWSGQLDSSGNFGYHLLYGTGKGSKPEDNNFRKYFMGVDAKLMDKKIIFAFNYDFETQAAYDKDYLPSKTDSLPQSKSTIEAFLGLQLENFTVGFELVNQTQVNNKSQKDTVVTKDTLLDVKPFGISFFVKASVIKDKLLLFGRYDMVNQDTEYKSDRKYKALAYKPYNETFMTFGLDWTPNKNVHIIPNIWINSYTDNRKKPDGYDKTKDFGKYWERSADFVPRLTFFYVFK
ncbi:MAG: hypothetical protein A3H98_08375 [Bacteroidetes bacterium RIFCSPLOWO2_02_FULL_36_8]|nr:MAG: hypothetical protein A3H98_08375 [Bacteroidetes bacterium RIFCSPLOWO2_02_FULL_36_8]OFY68851.1 MAG: hypothetical protein A3G23_03430 [Bacteroidetes bacterium RIFCSPLOWO2_12_FULL_37_12]